MKAFFAPWVLPVCQPPIANAVVVVDDEGILKYVGDRNQMPACDVEQSFPNHAILPGLVNAHTHLEFSNLKKPLGNPGIEFTQWIAKVVGYRRDQQHTDQSKHQIIQSGIQESLSHGVVAIGEIATSPVQSSHYSNNGGCLLSVFEETLGADKGDYDTKIAKLESNLQHLKTANTIPGLSPHAPYSVPLELLQRIVRVAEKNQTTVAMHIAETVDEREFIAKRSGRLVEMLEQFGVWRPNMYPTNDSVLKILKTLARAQRSLVIHGNYLTDEELDFVRSVKQRMSIVFCARTHAFFGHLDYPMAEILERGINLAVGTDSRASNPDLNLMNELKEIRRRFPDVSAETILRMGTIHGASALGIADRVGTLECGRAGQMCFARLSDPNDPYSFLIKSQPQEK